MDAINVAVNRGDIVESRHLAHAVFVRDGEVAEAWGDPDLVAYVRSAAKPLQALPLVPTTCRPRSWRSPAPRTRRGRSSSSPSGRCSSGRGASTDDLECGAEHGSRLRHNCSGKHAGFLFLCRARGWETEGYRLPTHPLQHELRGLVATTVGRPTGEVETAIDGCGVPTFALSLTEMARMFAGFAAGEPPGMATAVAAMTAHPELVGGRKAVDTLVMRALPGAIAKRGAEGVLCAGFEDGRGLALKVEDGGYRAAYAAAGAVLEIPELAERPLHSSRGDVVGSITAGL